MVYDQIGTGKASSIIMTFEGESEVELPAVWVYLITTVGNAFATTWDRMSVLK